MVVAIRLLPCLLGFLLAGCSATGVGVTAGSGMPGIARPETADHYSAVLVGRFASLTRDPRRALESYEAALKLDPDDGDMAERGVFNALMAGEFEKAVSMARRSGAAPGRGSALARLTLASDAIRKGRSQHAADLLAGDDFGPFNRTMAQNLRAWSLLETQGVDAARASLPQLEQTGRANASAVGYMHGLIALAAGEEGPARDVFADIWDNGPRLAVSTEMHARLLAAGGARDAAVSVLATFRDEVGPHPGLDSLRARLAAGETLPAPRPGRREGAALAIYAPAAILDAQSGNDLAGVYYAMALAIDPDLDIARTLWADMLDSGGRRADAIAVLRGVDEASVFYATARGQIAWALRRQGRDAEALTVARDALAHAPDRDLRIQLGDLFASLGRDGQAEAVFSELIDADRDAGRSDWRLFLARGAARERLGRWPEAERDLRSALALAPDEPSILNHLGYGWIDRGMRLREGLELIKRAALLDPRSGMIRDSLGWAHYRLGHYARAVAHLERAATLVPGDPVVNDHLGDAYWRTGRRFEAHYQWRRALNLTTESDLAEALRRKISTGLPVPGAGSVAPASHTGPATP
jgi:tetratricopeptide (TPR) repeat protein